MAETDTDLRESIESLERRIGTLTNLVDKLQNELIKAGRYENPDPDTHVKGIQIFLTRAGEAKGRDKGRRR